MNEIDDQDHPTAVSHEDHVLGPASAPVTLIEYGDFECPHTSELAGVIERLRSTFGKDLRMVFRHFPLNELHPHAQQAAEASECAAAQGKFWEMQAMLVQNHSALDPRNVFEYVDRLRLDRMKFAVQLGRRRFAGRVQRDLETGSKLGVDETPTLFLNGVKYTGEKSFEALASAIEKELKSFLQSKVLPLASRRVS